MARHGGYTDEALPLATRMLLYSRIEAAVLVFVIAIMVAKPDGGKPSVAADYVTCCWIVSSSDA